MTRLAHTGRPVPAWPGDRVRSGRLVAIAAVAVPTAVLAAHMLAYGRWIVDDAAITFGYARSIATGAGPVLQPGAEVVEGYSNPAWLAVLVTGRLLGLFDDGTWFGVPDQVLFPKAVALLCGAGVFAGFQVVARSIWPGPSRRAALVTAVAGSVTALVPSFAIWFASGLENPLLTLAATTTAAVLARAVARGGPARPGVAVACGLLAALAALTRPDGAIYLLAYPLVVLLTLRRDRWRALVAAALSGLAFAVPFGGYLCWRVLTFGRWVPNTAVAKAQQLPGLGSLQRPGQLLSYPGWPAALVLVGAVAVALSRPGRHRGVLLAVLVPLILAVTAFGVLEQDWMRVYRFATPVWALAALAGTISLTVLLPDLRGRGRALVAILLVGACLLTGLTWLDGARRFRAGPTISMCTTAVDIAAPVNAIGQILGIRSGTVVTPDVGGTALVSRYRIVDLAGLASARIADLTRAGDMAGLREYLFTEVRPAFIETHGSWSRSTGLLHDPRMARDYLPIMVNGPSSGLYVRRALVPGPAALAAATGYVERVARPDRARHAAAPRSSCGELTVGATRVGGDGLTAPQAGPGRTR